MTRRMLTALALAALVGGGAACGGDDGGGVATEPVPDDPDVVVVAEDMAFDPREVEVPADTPVPIVIDNATRASTTTSTSRTRPNRTAPRSRRVSPGRPSR